MDRVWRSAPLAALHVQAARDGLRLEPNEAAQRWAARHSISEADWQMLAASRLSPWLPARATLALGAPLQQLDCQRVALADDEWLFWLAPLPGRADDGSSFGGSRSLAGRMPPPAETDSAGLPVDLSERELARALLERERERMEFAIEAAGLGIWERSLDGSRIHWNRTMYLLRGFDPADPRSIEQLVAQCSHPDDLALLEATALQHLADGRPYRCEFRVRAAAGGWCWLGTQGGALRDAQGRALGMAGIDMDINDRKHADELRRLRERAQQASRDKSAFLARVSHELRTPMNAMLGFTQLLAEDPLAPPTAAQQARLQRITDAGRRMMTLVDELLELARQEGPPSSPPLTAGPPGGAPLRVLCVEDNPVNLLLVRELLAQRPGVRLHEAVDGRSGIEAALAQPPDLLLLDLQLPDMPGLKVLHRLRAEPALAGCRFVALSADALPAHIADALSAGFDDYWTKPIDFVKFLAGIDRLAAERQGASRSSSQPPWSARR